MTSQICSKRDSYFNIDIIQVNVTFRIIVKLIECGIDDISPLNLCHIKRQVFLNRHTSFWISHNFYYETEIYVNISPY